MVKIDLNFTNVNGALNSSLLKTYTLFDQRFSILSIYFKKIIKDLKISNDGNNNQGRINNFSWTLILLTFLQDVLDPPIFPILKQKYHICHK